MRSRSEQTVQVPNDSRDVPYRIDDPDPSDKYVRIRKPGPDLLVLVPPGMDATGHKQALVDSMRGEARSKVQDRSKDNLLRFLLYVVVPVILIGGAIASAALLAREGSSGARDVFTSVLPYVMVVALLAYLVVLLAPSVGIAASLNFTKYPADPEYMMRRLRDSQDFRYLTERQFQGSADLNVLRRGVVDRPETVDEHTWAVLWILAGGGELYASAHSALQEDARYYRNEECERHRPEFLSELEVTIEDFMPADDKVREEAKGPEDASPRHRADTSSIEGVSAE